MDYVLKRYSWITPRVFLPDYLKELAENLLPDETFVKSFSEMKAFYNPSKPTKTTKWDGITSPMKIHLLDYAFLKLCDENPQVQHKNYLQIDPLKAKSREFPLPKDYVVLTTGFTATVREWPAAEVNRTARWCVDKGYTPVFLGQRHTKTGSAHGIEGKFKDDVDYSIGRDLIDKTTLVEAALVMKDAKAVLGVDNGLLHLAGCTEVPIIAGFTTVSPQIRLPVRKDILGWDCSAVVPDYLLDCAFCQEKTNFLYGHDYRNCMHKGDVSREALCTKQMTAEKFINYLEAIL